MVMAAVARLLRGAFFVNTVLSYGEGTPLFMFVAFCSSTGCSSTKTQGNAGAMRQR